jgi:DUF1009 family protein
MSQKLGIIAGGGSIAAQVASYFSASGGEVFIVAIDGAGYDDDTRSADVTLNIGQIGGIMAAFRGADITNLVMVGDVDRPDLSNLQLDDEGHQVLTKFLELETRGDDALLRVISQFLQDGGFNILAPESILDNLTAPSGYLTLGQASSDDQKDIERGVDLLKAIARFDIGQGCVVSQGQVLAIEGPEGTDAMLQRVIGLSKGIGPLAADPALAKKGSGVLVKLPKLGQERRIDLPTIGLRTIENAIQAGLSGIVFEGGGALIVDREACKSIANDAGIFLLGLDR